MFGKTFLMAAVASSAGIWAGCATTEKPVNTVPKSEPAPADAIFHISGLS